MELDPIILSRLQFAWVIAWHILLPAFTVGLASFIALIEGLKLVTGREVYVRISTFWIKIFSIAFGMGVVTGVVMPFQIGTNWSRFSDAIANVLSPLFGYEGLTAFFLRQPFLVFCYSAESWCRLGPILHLCADGRIGHFVLVILDSGGEQLDADAGRLRDRQRPVLFKGLVPGDLQPFFPLPVGARRCRLLCYQRFCRARRRRLSRPATELC